MGGANECHLASFFVCKIGRLFRPAGSGVLEVVSARNALKFSSPLSPPSPLRSYEGARQSVRAAREDDRLETSDEQMCLAHGPAYYEVMAQNKKR